MQGLSQGAVPSEGAGGVTPPAVQVSRVFGGDGGFEFALPIEDASATFLDLSWLNDEQADRRITVIDGRFAYADTGEPLRFFGINMGPDDAFPEPHEADMIAARLAKLGINIVRLHHLDNMWARSEGKSVWPEDGPLDRLEPKSLDRLGYLVAALKRNGIYCNLNLKVSKELGPQDGVPEGINFVHQKRVDRYYKPLIEHQKWYARQLLSWVNPHTGLTFADDPAIAMLEINNENSIMHLWSSMPLAEGWEALDEFYRGELARQWQNWLKSHYEDDAQLEAAWRGTRATPAVSTEVRHPERWVGIGQLGAEIQTLTTEQGVVVSVENPTGTDWHAQLLWQSLELTPGESYTLELELSASKQRELRVSVDRQADGTYGNVGLDRTLEAGPKRQTFELSFTALDPDTVNRIVINAGAESAGVFTIHAASLRTGWSAKDEVGSLAKGGFSLEGPRSPQHRRDWFSFLIETERTFSDMMRAFLRDELGVEKPMFDSQIQWGQTAAYEREGFHLPRGSDYSHTHFYWQHPSFPQSKSWNMTDWTIKNSSMVEALARGEAGPLGVAMYRVQGVPFGIGEIDQAAPSDWAAELLPLISSFAAAQDWNAIYFYTLGELDPQKPGISGFFDQIKHTAKAGQFPAAALIFRRGLIPPIQATRTLLAPTPLWPVSERQSQAWRTVAEDATQPQELLSYRIGIELTPKAEQQLQMDERAGSSPLALRAGSAPLYTATSDRAALAVGFWDDRPVSLDKLRFEASGSDVGFGAVSLVCLDDQPLSTSRRMLLTVIGRAQNQAMQWNDTRTSVSDQWGHGPMLVQIPRLEVTLPQDNLQVWALSPTGERKRMITLNGRSLQVTPEHQTIYYEISSKD